MSHFTYIVFFVYLQVYRSCVEIWYYSIDSLPLNCQSCSPVSISWLQDIVWDHRRLSSYLIVGVAHARQLAIFVCSKLQRGMVSGTTTNQSSSPCMDLRPYYYYYKFNGQSDVASSSL